MHQTEIAMTPALVVTFPRSKAEIDICCYQTLQAMMNLLYLKLLISCPFNFVLLATSKGGLVMKVVMIGL